MVQTLSIFGDSSPKPLFSTQADYEQFREDYIAAVSPQLKQWEEARRKSEEAARTRWVD